MHKPKGDCSQLKKRLCIRPVSEHALITCSKYRPNTRSVAAATVTKGQPHRKPSMSASLFLLVCCCLGCTLEPSSSSGSNETNLLSRRSIPAYCRGMTNMLVVTTTMRMLHRVHSHTTNLQPLHKQVSNQVETCSCLIQAFHTNAINTLKDLL